MKLSKKRVLVWLSCGTVQLLTHQAVHKRVLRGSSEADFRNCGGRSNFSIEGTLGPRGCLSSKPEALPSRPPPHPVCTRDSSLAEALWHRHGFSATQLRSRAGGRWQLSGKIAKPQSLAGPPARVWPSAFPLRPEEAWVSGTFSPTFPDPRVQQEAAALLSYIHSACPPARKSLQLHSQYKNQTHLSLCCEPQPKKGKALIKPRSPSFALALAAAEWVSDISACSNPPVNV